MKPTLIKNQVSKIITHIIQSSSFWLQVLLLTVFLSLKFLLVNNMGNVNELDVLPLARQYVDPAWISQDWYLNQPPGYRLLFQAIFGKLAVTWGFLATSLIGRFVCYYLVASGLVLIGRRLGLNFVFLLLSIILFIYVDPGVDPYKDQGVVVHEWIVGGLEAKAIAYGLVLLAIGWMLEGRYGLLALTLGLATSFHVLVGGWTFLAVLSWLALNRKKGFRDVRYLVSFLFLYLITSAFAIPAVLQHLGFPNPTGTIDVSYIEASYIYVFLRLPHHLNPLSWVPGWWLSPLIYLLVLGISVTFFRYRRNSTQSPEIYDARLGLARFALLTLIPFALGLLIAPFDTQGKLLQYYPFRLGDVILPLSACLLLFCALNQLFNPKVRRIAILIGLVILGSVYCVEATSCQKQLVKIQQFPSQTQDLTSAWQDMCLWIRQHTPQESLVISPPVEFANFSWLSERATIAKYKLLPQNEAGVMSWYNRLNDLSGETNPWQLEPGEQPGKNTFKKALTEGYVHLGTDQVKRLMHQYQANYFVTRLGHQLDLPVAYQNVEHILYTVSEAR